MSEHSAQILKEALSLPSDDRVELVDRLLASLDTPNPDIDALWVREAEDRIDAYERGEIPAIPAKDVFDAIRKKKH